MNKGPFLVLTTYIFWGLLPVYWKFLANINAFFILSNRIIWSFVFTALLVTVFRRYRKEAKQAFADKTIRNTLFLASFLGLINWGSYIYAVSSNHVLDASLAYYLNPILSIIIAASVFREHLSLAQWSAVALATFGVLYSVWESHQLPWLALIIGGSWAVYGAIKKNIRLEGVVSLQIEMAFMLLPMLVLATYFLQTNATGGVAGWQWLLLPTTGIVTAVPLIFYANGIKTTDYSLAGLLMYVNPTLQLLCGVWLFGEAFTKTHAVTFAFVWSALLLYALSSFFSKPLHH